MGTVEANFIGLAGEFRVMSELLLRGHNPAKSYLENGIDMVLENGKRVEVKSSHKTQYIGQNPRYHFDFRRGHDKLQNISECDFVVCWCIDDNYFYIIPVDFVTTASLSLTVNGTRYSKYRRYKDAWGLLK